MQNWETPLHFACKFGHADIVEYLVSHPLTDVQRPNKYGETPAQVRYKMAETFYLIVSSQLYSQLLGELDSEDDFHSGCQMSVNNNVVYFYFYLHRTYIDSLLQSFTTEAVTMYTEFINYYY